MRVTVSPAGDLEGATIVGQARIQVEGAPDVRALLVEKGGLKYLAFRKGDQVVALRWEPLKGDPDNRGLREYY